MAPVKVLRPPLCGDSAADVPREHWPLLLEERRRFCHESLPHDCRLLILFVEDGAKADWLGFADRESYIRDGLGLDPELVEWAIEGLSKTDPNAAVSLDRAVVLGKHGGKRVRGGQGNNITLDRGTNPDYTLARLRRDNPELAEQVEQGALSANAAAIQAGFRKPMLSIPKEPEGAARAIKRHFTASEIETLIDLLVQ